MPMVMQSRDDMMEELMEVLMDEGMTQEEAKEFIQALFKPLKQLKAENHQLMIKCLDFIQPGALLLGENFLC